MIHFVWKSKIILNLKFPNFYNGSSSSIAKRALEYSVEEQGFKPILERELKKSILIC
jgi:hypothetical protein